MVCDEGSGLGPCASGWTRGEGRSVHGEAARHSWSGHRDLPKCPRCAIKEGPRSVGSLRDAQRLTPAFAAAVWVAARPTARKNKELREKQLRATPKRPGTSNEFRWAAKFPSVSWPSYLPKRVRLGLALLSAPGEPQQSYSKACTASHR